MPRMDSRNTTRYWSDRGLAGLSLLLAEFTTHEYAPHSHDGFVIAITEKGGAIIKSGRETVEARPNALFVSNPGELQSAHMGPSRHWRYRSFSLSDPALAKVTQYVGTNRSPCFVHSSLQDPGICHSLLALHRALACEHDSFATVERLTSLFGRLFTRHGASHAPGGTALPDRHCLEPVVARMKEEFRERLELADLASVAGLTVFQLIGLFRRVTGLTPHAFLIQLRLDAARQQLKDGAALAEAAIASGFYDQSALTKHFKRAYGITPGQFAAAARAH